MLSLHFLLYLHLAEAFQTYLQFHVCTHLEKKGSVPHFSNDSNFIITILLFQHLFLSSSSSQNRLNIFCFCIPCKVNIERTCDTSVTFYYHFSLGKVHPCAKGQHKACSAATNKKLGYAVIVTLLYTKRISDETKHILARQFKLSLLTAPNTLLFYLYIVIIAQLTYILSMHTP